MIDFIKEASAIQVKPTKSCENSSCENKNSKTFISSALYEKLGKTSFSFLNYENA